MMKECIDKMLVILPFEKDYFKQKWDWDVEYVGHPLVEVIDLQRSEAVTSRISPRPIVALLPGSRKQEILKKLPVMLKVSEAFPDHQFVVAKAPGVDEAFYDGLLSPFANVSYVSNQTYNLLSQADAALVTSGTATLETALFGVPEVVCYRGSAISYQIAKRVIRVKYISLVNLIMDKLVVKELIQQELTVANLRKELDDLLYNKERKDQLKKDYADLKELLGRGGNASAKAARSIVGLLLPPL
jgi:lipid-A-disaccharide synthase